MVLAALPSLACGLLLLWGARATQSWVEGWRALSGKLLGQEIARFDLVQVLGLERAVEVLQAVTAASPLALLVVVACLALVSGLLLAGALVLLGLAYNALAFLTGGIIVETGSSADPDARTDDR
jgi:hypothetical protein